MTGTLTCQTFASTDVPKAIPDNTPAGVSSVLTSTLTGSIADVDVLGLVGTHTWINDLSVHLARPDATSVNVMARSCTNQDNFNLNLDDAAAGAPGAWPCPPVGGGTYKPSNPLSGLNGTAANGTWTLRLQDHVGQDTGTLSAWSLRICAAQAVSGPVANDDSYTATEDTPRVVAAPGVLVNDTGSGLTATVVTAPPVAQGALTLAANGGFTFDPAPNFCGASTFTYAANSGPLSDTATVTINVACVNDAPMAANDAYVLNEDAPLTQPAPGVLVNDSDVEGSALTAINASTPTIGAVTLQTTGGFTYTPNANACGSDQFTYQAHDGAANSVAATVGLTVTCLDDAPVAVADSATVVEDSGATAIDVLANDTDIDGGARSIQSVTQPANGTVAITGGGTGLTFTPNANFCSATAQTFTYTLNGGSIGTVSVTVTCVDDGAAVANDDARTVAEDSGASTFNVLTNDTADPDDGSLAVTAVGTATNGTTSFTATGVTYTPNANFCSVTPDSFSYTVNGGDTATVSVTVTCIDDAPVAVADSATVAEDSGANAIDVLANDTDVDAGPRTIQSVTQPANGTVAITGGGTGLTFAPNANFCSATAQTFTYTLNGGSIGTVSVTVTCVDDGAAVANDDSRTVAEDSGASTFNVLANDTADPDDGSLAVTGVGDRLERHDRRSRRAPHVSYTPNANYCSATPDSFSYTINGGDTATVSVTVTCVDDGAAVANDDVADRRGRLGRDDVQRPGERHRRPGRRFACRDGGRRRLERDDVVHGDGRYVHAERELLLGDARLVLVHGQRRRHRHRLRHRHVQRRRAGRGRRQRDGRRGLRATPINVLAQRHRYRCRPEDDPVDDRSRERHGRPSPAAARASRTRPTRTSAPPRPTRSSTR